MIFSKKSLTMKKILLLVLLLLNNAYADYSSILSKADKEHEVKNYLEANHLYQQAYKEIKTRDQLIYVLSALSASEISLGNKNQAATYINRVLKLSPKNSKAWKFMRKHRLKKKQILQELTHDNFQKTIQRGNKFSEECYFNKAKENYLKALSLSPSRSKEISALASLIVTYKRLQNSKLSEMHEKRLSRFDPKNTWLRRYKKGEFNLKLACNSHKKETPPSVFAKNCSTPPEYACSPRIEESTAISMCTKVFESCDDVGKSKLNSKNFIAYARCEQTTQKILNVKTSSTSPLEVILRAASESVQRNAQSSEQLKSKAYNDGLNVLKKFGDQGIYKNCITTALDACRKRYNSWKQGCVDVYNSVPQ